MMQGKSLWLYWIWTEVSKQTERCEACYTHRHLIDSQFPGVQSLIKLLIMQISERNVEGMEHAHTGFLQLHRSQLDLFLHINYFVYLHTHWENKGIAQSL